MITGPKLVKFLRIAGALIAGGLLIEGITLMWSHPISFLLYLGIGGLLMVAGILLYLYTVVSRG